MEKEVDEDQREDGWMG